MDECPISDVQHAIKLEQPRIEPNEYDRKLTRLPSAPPIPLDLLPPPKEPSPPPDFPMEPPPLFPRWGFPETKTKNEDAIMSGDFMMKLVE